MIFRNLFCYAKKMREYIYFLTVKLYFEFNFLTSFDKQNIPTKYSTPFLYDRTASPCINTQLVSKRFNLNKCCKNEVEDNNHPPEWVLTFQVFVIKSFKNLYHEKIRFLSIMHFCNKAAELFVIPST